MALIFLVPPPPTAGRRGPCIYQGIDMYACYSDPAYDQGGRFVSYRGRERPDLAPYSFSESPSDPAA